MVCRSRRENVNLSPQQKKILEGIAAGKKRATIAVEMDISVHTVNDYVKRIYARLDCHTGAEAFAKYLLAREPELNLWDERKAA